MRTHDQGGTATDLAPVQGAGFYVFAKNIWKNCVKADTLRQICYCSSVFSFASPKENAGASEMTTAERAAASDISYPLCSFLPSQTANCIRGLAGISISLRTSLNRPRKPLRFSWIFPAIADNTQKTERFRAEQSPTPTNCPARR